MWLGRFNNGGVFADYFVSLKKQNPIDFEVYSNPPRVEKDYYPNDEIVIIRKYNAEKAFNIKLKNLEQIEI